MASINDLATAAVASISPPPPDGASASAIATATSPASAVATSPASAALPPGVVRGAFVALEGLDRSGKTTQVKLLEQRFVELGRKVKVLRFPGQWTPMPHQPAVP